jgi:hypothetical protein
MKIKFISILLCALFLASCAHTPTKGDKMMEASNNAKALSKQWEQANKLSSQGSTQHSKGVAMIQKGQAQVIKGNKLIANGNQLTHHGKQKFNQGKQLQEQTENTFDEQYVDSPQ